MRSRYTPVFIHSQTLGLVLNTATQVVSDDPAAPGVPSRGWTIAENCHFYENEIRKIYGWRRHIGGSPEVTGTPSLFQTFEWADGTKSGCIGTTTRLYKLEAAGTLTQLNAVDFTGGLRNRWSADIYLNTAVFTNKTDVIQKWVGNAATCAALGGTPPKAVTLAVGADHLMLGNINSGSEAPYSCANSDLSDIEGWNFAGTGEADLFPITESSGPIARVIRLGGNLLVAYKGNSIHTLHYINPDIVFYLQNIVSKMGAFSGWSVLDLDQRHFFMGQDDFYIFNGTPELLPVGTRIWQDFLTKVRSDSRDIVWSFHDQKRKQIIIGFRSVDGNNTDDKALLWSYAHNAYSYIAWPFSGAGYVPKIVGTSATWDAQTTSWDSHTDPWDTAAGLADLNLMAGDTSGNVWIAFDESTALLNGSTAINMRLESGDFAHAGWDKVAQLGGMLLDVPVDTGSSPLQLYIGTRDNLMASISWNGPFNYSGNGRIDCMAAGRFIRYAFVKNGGHVRIRSYAPLIQGRGYY